MNAFLTRDIGLGQVGFPEWGGGGQKIDMFISTSEAAL